MIFLRSLFSIFMLSLLAFSVTSCTEDEALTPNPSFQQENTSTPVVQKISSNTLVGDWTVTSLDYAGTSTTSQGGNTFTTNFSAVGKDFNLDLTFRDNPKTYSSNGGYTVDLTTYFDTTSMTQEVIVPSTSSSGTWSLSGNTLSITDSLTNETNSTEILRAGNNTFSIDYAGFTGQSNMGANVNLTSGQITYQRKP